MMRTRCEPRVAVIGAGPAGCAAAIGLAVRGLRVTIIEKARFPRVKVCGEYVSPAATALLESLLPVNALRALGARRVDRFMLGEGGRERSWRMPGASWTLSRGTLDAALLEKARAVGAEVLQPLAVRDVEYDDRGVRIRTTHGERIDAEVVIHADGSGRFDPAGPAPMRKGLVGRKCHLRPAQGIDTCLRMRCARGAYIGTVGVEGGLITCALVARSELVARSRGDADAMLRELWPAYDPASRATGWLSCGVPSSSYIAPGHPRSFRIGNAAAAVDPIGGEGIGLALWAGMTLAATLDVSDLAKSQRAFASAYRRRLAPRRVGCRVAAEICARPALVRALWPALRAPETRDALLGAFWGATGKRVRA